MKLKTIGLSASSLIGAALLFGSGSASADALSTPAMSTPLAANSSPVSFDAGPLGNLYVTGQLTGLGLFQTNHSGVSGDHPDLFDLSNGQVEIQKTDGWFQFYVQGGEYSLPSLGLPYIRAASNTNASFGVIPVAYLKIVPTDNFSVEAGKLPTLIGAEYTFTFENTNIERGLLWNLEPAISKGVQVNYSTGPISLSVALTDGAYTNRYNQLSGLVSWTIESSDTLAFAASGDLGKPLYPYGSYFGGFSPVNSESVFNLIWTHTDGPWTITPYAQYTHVGSWMGVLPATSTWGGAVIANYAFDSNWSLAGRVEYVSQNNGYDPFLYGSGSSAWSVTITPTYQYKVFFARADLSYVGANHVNAYISSLDGAQAYPYFGGGFGTKGDQTGQFRAVIEAGVLF